MCYAIFLQILKRYKARNEITNIKFRMQHRREYFPVKFLD